jgi:glucosamine-6-phosphate deaminase
VSHLHQQINKIILQTSSMSTMSTVQKKVYDTKIEASVYVANQVAALINKNNSLGKATVLGLATGSSPIEMYKELIRLHKEEGLSFKSVITFNLDEYMPMDHSSEKSYHYFMDHNLFNHIDIDKSNVNVPSGDLNESEVSAYCDNYEAQIEKAGGLDIQILGIGRTGHVGFNEPGSSEDSITRMVILNKVTVADAAPDFGGEENVPSKAITMGVSTIMKAKKVYLMAWGQKKADIVNSSLTDDITDEVPATYLQNHSDVEYVLDKGAAGE